MSDARIRASLGCCVRSDDMRRRSWRRKWVSAASVFLLAAVGCSGTRRVTGDGGVVGVTAQGLTLADAQTICAAYPGRNVIVGTDGDDVLDGTNQDDCIVAGAGKDKVKAGNGNDIVFGGDGDDEISGGNGEDTVF